MRSVAILAAVACSLNAVEAPGAPSLTVDETYHIVVAEDQTEAEEYAAAQLREYLAKITGTPPRIVPEPRGEAKPAIYLGRTRFAAAADMEGYDREEYHIRTVGSNLVITGGRPRGVLFGTYEFLERFAGVRYLSVDCEHVPTKPAVELESLVGASQRRCRSGVSL